MRRHPGSYDALQRIQVHGPIRTLIRRGACLLYTSTHCKLSWDRILPNLIARDDGLTPLASKQWAYRDLKAVGRNLDLVDMDELEDDDDWN